MSGNVKDVFTSVTEEMSKIIVGQEEVMEFLYVALLTEGHILLEGVPGVAKTLIVKTLSAVINCDFKRIQFTPDLMPGDISGTHVFNPAKSEFYLKKGPVFTNFLLADEINRTPPKTQAALLESMEERQVTIEGETIALPSIFMVLATQNPIEYEGTYPLPEAQLDRFLLKVNIKYPSEKEENQILQNHHRGFNPHNRLNIKSLADINTILECRNEVQKVKVEEKIFDYIIKITGRTRETVNLILGASPRASVMLLLASKALAALRGRDFVIPDDVKYLACPVLRHRLVLRSEAEIEGVSADDIILNILQGIEVPR
jgi:MoxR-like ATPase